MFLLLVVVRKKVVGICLTRIPPQIVPIQRMHTGLKSKMVVVEAY